MQNTATFSSETGHLNKQILTDLYEKHSPELFRYAYRLLGDQQLAEDCVAEVFSRLLQAVSRGITELQNARAYLFRMAHNWVTDHYRRRQPEGAEALEEIRDEHSNPAQIVSAELERRRVRTALLQLPEDQRRVIELHLLERWSHEEVAQALGRTVEATRALQYRALVALRKLLVD